MQIKGTFDHYKLYDDPYEIQCRAYFKEADQCKRAIIFDRKEEPNRYVYFAPAEQEMGTLRELVTTRAEMRIVPEEDINKLQSECPKGIAEIQRFDYKGTVEEEYDYPYCEGDKLLNIRFKADEEVPKFFFKKFNNYSCKTQEEKL